ncbi:hypothetical protein JOM56_014382 [Amanita muscaria]
MTDLNLQGQFLFPFGGNESSQAGQVLRRLLIHPQRSSGPAHVQLPHHLSHPYPSSQELSDINPHSLYKFGENEHSQPGNSQALWSLHIPPSGAAGPPTSSTTTTALSAQSSMGFSAASNDVIQTAEEGRHSPMTYAIPHSQSLTICSIT